MFKFLKDKQLKREGNTVRKFSYDKQGTNLNFSLRTDIKTELKDFLVCLEAAVEDVKEELNKFQ